MKKYTIPAIEVISLGAEGEVMETLTLASIHDNDNDKTEFLPIKPGNPEGGTDNWGGDAKGWTEWDD